MTRRSPATLAVLLLVLAPATCAPAAATLYKCVAEGKVRYSDQACPARQQPDKIIRVPAPPPETDAARTARLAAERDRWRAAEAGFGERQAERDRSERDAQATARAEAEAHQQRALEAAARRAEAAQARERARAEAYAFCLAYPKRC